MASPLRTVGAEQRASPRVNLQGFIECIGPSAKVHRELADIGLGGMFIDSHPTPFQPGENLRLAFYLSRAEPRLSVKAEVLYVQDGIGMGVRFVDLDPLNRERIASYLDQATLEKRPPLRKSSRVCVSVPVALWISNEEDAGFEDAHIVTLSKYGACVETSQPLSLGQRVFLATRSGLEFKANVVWVGGASNDGRPQAGVRCRGLAQALGFRFP
jgi:hypothetical protein